MTVQTVQKIQKATVVTVVRTLQLAFLIACFLVLTGVVAAAMAFGAS